MKKINPNTFGAQYEPPCNGSVCDRRFDNLKNWSCAIGYGVGSNPLSPSFNVCLELAKNSQLIASFCQHLVVQTRVQNPLEENEMRITNYIDWGFELQTRVDGVKSTNNFRDSTFQVAASWQADKNFLLKGKLGTRSANVALALKAWWNPAVTFHISATKSTEEKTGFGFGIRFENLDKIIKPDERADPMVTPNSDPLADQNMLYNVGTNSVPLADQNMLYNVGRY